MGAWATKSTGDTLTAVEFNLLANEIENQETAGTETPSAGSSDQLAKSIVNVVGNGDFYTGGGAADVYTATVIAPNVVPSSLRVGMKVRFRPSVNNTGASTINVASLGVESIKLQDGASDPVAGDISTARDTEIRWDGTNWIIISQFNDASETVKGISELVTVVELDGDTGGDRVLSSDNFVNSKYGKLSLKEIITISGSVTNFEIDDLDQTKSYEIEISELTVDTGGVDLLYTASDDNGSTYKATGYYGAGVGNASSADTREGLDQDNASSLILNAITRGIETNGTIANACYGAKIHLFKSSNRLNKLTCLFAHEAPTTDFEAGFINGGVRNTDIDAIKFSISAGNITNAIITVWEKA